MRTETFVDTADDRYTDRELMVAIFIVAGRNDAEATRVWEDPTDAEITAIIEIVTQNGKYPTEDFCWGAAGENWAGE